MVFTKNNKEPPMTKGAVMKTKVNLTLSVAWGKRAKLWAEGDKLWAEGDKLRAEGAKLWAEAIIETFGNIKLEWFWVSEKKDYKCTLENGEVYEP